MRKGKDPEQDPHTDPYLWLTVVEHCWELSSRRRILASVIQSRESDSDFDRGFSDTKNVIQQFTKVD